MKREIKSKIRAEIANYLWEKYKNQFSMKELAHILNWNVVNFFRSLKKVKKYTNSPNSN
jgi:hypothetical protein